MPRRKRTKKGRGKKRSVRAPAAKGQRIVVGNPLHRIRIAHREYITDVVQGVSGAHEVTQLDINASDSAAFPWLSSIATSFEKYKVIACTYEYVSTVPTTRAGAIAICPDYDPRDTNEELSKAELLSFADTARSNVWDSFSCKVDCSKIQADKLFVRHTPHILNERRALRLTDPFSITVMHNAATTGIMGELWVSYVIDLFTPQHEGLEVPGASFTFTPTDVTEPWPAPTETHLNTGAFRVRPDDEADLNSHIEVMEVGEYEVVATGLGTGLSAVHAPTLHGAQPGDSISQVTNMINAGGTAYTIVWKLVMATTLSRITPLIIHWGGFVCTTIAEYVMTLTKVNPELML